MREVPDTIACPSCDAIFHRAQLNPRDVAHCQRCGTELERHAGTLHRRVLPLTLASLILFAIASLFPIVSIETHGLHSETTLVGAVFVLGAEGMAPVALLVLVTTLLFPLLHLCILIWVLVPLQRGRRTLGFAGLVRIMQSLRPWGMIEVFLLGILVAVIKLSGMATVVVGPALWAFVVLTVLLTMVLAFDPRGLWEMAFDRQPGT
ncbi:paraquat-inducible protein A [Variovorax rhizosphaerae]|uniref:Paraquat-inducible protein A n=1 Tax=Variovorax rhizosphaerae TaxID=1836200 RepID=A0ABU8WU75_9BURK